MVIVRQSRQIFADAGSMGGLFIGDPANETRQLSLQFDSPGMALIHLVRYELIFGGYLKDIGTDSLTIHTPLEREDAQDVSVFSGPSSELLMLKQIVLLRESAFRNKGEIMQIMLKQHRSLYSDIERMQNEFKVESEIAEITLSTFLVAGIRGDEVTLGLTKSFEAVLAALGRMWGENVSFSAALTLSKA